MLRKVKRDRILIVLCVLSLIGGLYYFKMSNSDDTLAWMSKGTVDEKKDLVDDGKPPAKDNRIPNVFIVGGEKCGATPLGAFLELHPDIVVAQGKQINFFNVESNFKQGSHWYKMKLPPVTLKTTLIENAPHFFRTDKVPQRMKQLYPNDVSVKLILILRNPVNRLLSEYADIKAQTTIQGGKYPAFEELVIEKGSNLMNTSYLPVIKSIYAPFLVRWAKFFTKDQFLFLDGDNFITNPMEELEKVETFLNLEHKIRDDQLYLNSTTGFYCIHKSENKNRCYTRPKGWTKPKVSDKHMDVIRHFFIHHNEKFLALSGKDFDWLAK